MTEAQPSANLTGLVACPGVISGIAQLANHPDFEDGGVLIASSTNPDLYPHMTKCKAMVTEVGGVLSHAAVVARELNIPCIVGVKGLLEKVQHGAMITVDAQQGVVYLS